MKTLIPNVLTDEMVETLISSRRNDNIKNQWDLFPFSEIVSAVQTYAPVKAGGQSYWRVERKSEGHKWHYDGCTLDLEDNHMSWCKYSAVGLLSDPSSFQGGEFLYADEESDMETPKSHRDELYKSLLVYSSGAENEPLLHSANPHRGGDRWMLLMFFEGE